MNRALAAALLSLPILSGCHRVIRAPMKTTIGMADPAIANQLVSGFYDLEAKSWRWTAKRFCVTFPGQSKEKDGTLTLHMFIPESQLQQLGQVTVAADVNGSMLQAETFSQPGMHSYTRTVPKTALQSNIVPVVFYLDKATPPSATEGRELGVIVNDLVLNEN